MNNPMLNVRPLLLSVLLSIASGAAVQANPTHNVSEIIDGVEFKLETDKAVYEYGELVQMTYSVTNHTDQSLGFVLNADGDGMGFNVRDPEAPLPDCSPSTGGCVFPPMFALWSSIHPFMTLPAFGTRTLPPGDTFSRSVNWDLRYSFWTATPNELVDNGRYIVSGSLNRASQYLPQDLPTSSRVSLEIEVIPEPATLTMLGFAALAVGRQRR